MAAGDDERMRASRSLRQPLASSAALALVTIALVAILLRLAG
jgi:hypothetical protein